jgi:FkbH-like protein
MPFRSGAPQAVTSHGARVREELPEVCVPDWPERATLYKSALLALPYFDSPSINMEDRDRTRMYVSERERQSTRKAIGSLENWLKTLETKVAVEELNDTNLSRVVQLFNKTNQMNLTTRRMTDGELTVGHVGSSEILGNPRKR